MLRFNLSILEEKTGCNPEYLVYALNQYYKGKHLPKNSNSKFKPIPKICINPTSFICNPEPLFSSKYDTIYKAQYIRLAGRRNIINYNIYKDKSLDLSLYPDLVISSIKHNPLLVVQTNKILFKFEEI